MALIIAEIGTSHNGSLEKAKKLVDCAVDAGADAVKFQWVYADEILHPDTGFVALPGGNIRLYDRFKQLECDYSFYKELREYVRSCGVKYVCSPFGLKSFSELMTLEPDFVKIASPELNHFPLLKELSRYRRNQKDEGKTLVPVIISSGVSLLSDIEKALAILGTEKVSLLHCITSYPAPEAEYNLKLITNLKNIFGVETGVSDHSLDPVLVPVLSVLCGGSVIEKHITLSRKTDGLDDPVALEGEKFALMVHVVHQAEAALKRYGFEKARQVIFSQLTESYDEKLIEDCLGDGVKRLAASEFQNYGRTNRSLHYLREMKKGEKISESAVAVLRTEKVLTPGISPEFYDFVQGLELSKDVKNGEGLQFSDFVVK